MSVLRCEKLDVRIAGIRVVSDLNLAIGPGEFWGLLGPNGIGKTTLLKCLAGLDEAAAGEVLLDTQPIDSLPRKLLARHLGMLQQHTVYVFDSSVKQTAKRFRQRADELTRPSAQVGRDELANLI